MVGGIRLCISLMPLDQDICTLLSCYCLVWYVALYAAALAGMLLLFPMLAVLYMIPVFAMLLAFIILLVVAILLYLPCHVELLLGRID